MSNTRLTAFSSFIVPQRQRRVRKVLPVPDLPKMPLERSNGIFGKSGTGKTFLTRLCLCGTIKEEKAVNLVFDMHSEYGWQGTTEDRSRGGVVRGLRQYFGARVLVYTLDPESSLRRGVPVQNQIRIPFSQVTV